MNPCSADEGNKPPIEAVSQCMGVLTMELGVKDRVALVFGAAGGLGRDVAESLAREGCRLALADVNEAGLANVHEAIDALKAPAVSLPWALGDSGAIEPKLKRVEDQLGPVDILVNKTGGQAPWLAADTPTETWGREFEAMVASAIPITAGVLPSTRVGASHHERLLRSRHAHPQSCNTERTSLRAGRVVENADARGRSRRRHGQSRRSGPDRDSAGEGTRRGESRAGGPNCRRHRGSQRRRYPDRPLRVARGICQRRRFSGQRSVVLRYGIVDPSRRRPHTEHLTSMV
jgi:NAD(P)-dependent dehydrogenase (short-subunit alcohol dehydrogenase family)